MDDNSFYFDRLQDKTFNGRNEKTILLRLIPELASHSKPSRSRDPRRGRKLAEDAESEPGTYPEQELDTDSEEHTDIDSESEPDTDTKPDAKKTPWIPPPSEYTKKKT